jgi:hypothetical protein
MVHFQFAKDDRVQVKDSGELGTVIFRGTDSTTNAPFYRVRLDGGEVKTFTDQELWPPR